MGERLKYYQRRQEVRVCCQYCREDYLRGLILQALDNPNDVVSMILDGMAQNHSMLPWLANLKTFDKHIQQHIIGVLTHGRDVKLYR